MSKTTVLNIAKIAKLKSIKYATLETRFLYLLLIADLEFLSDEKIAFILLFVTAT